MRSRNWSASGIARFRYSEWTTMITRKPEYYPRLIEYQSKPGGFCEDGRRIYLNLIVCLDRQKFLKKK
jgi:hypothetical protein